MAANVELMLEAALSKISGGKAQDRQFFLFDQLLVYCKENPMKKVRPRLLLSLCFLFQVV